MIFAQNCTKMMATYIVRVYLVTPGYVIEWEKCWEGGIYLDGADMNEFGNKYGTYPLEYIVWKRA